MRGLPWLLGKGHRQDAFDKLPDQTLPGGTQIGGKNMLLTEINATDAL